MKVSKIRLKVLVRRGYKDRYADRFNIDVVDGELILENLPEDVIETLWFDHAFDPGPEREINPNWMSREKLEEALALIELRFAPPEECEVPQPEGVVAGNYLELHVNTGPTSRQIYRQEIAEVRAEVHTTPTPP